jgi:CheY-like chemotaxis protein
MTEVGTMVTRVLLVEDNLVNQKVASKLIEKLGFAVDVAPDGRKALEATERNDYGLILMDCQMPVMDGYEATVEIRRREADGRRRVPIVALTAHALESNKERCLGIGMDDFVTKPITADRMRSVLDSWLGPPASVV